MSSGNSSLDNVIWIAMAGGLFGLLGLCVRAVTRSNCKEFSCCYGLLSCSRQDAHNHTVVPVHQQPKQLSHQETMTDIDFGDIQSISPTSANSQAQAESSGENFQDALCFMNAIGESITPYHNYKTSDIRMTV